MKSVMPERLIVRPPFLVCTRRVLPLLYDAHPSPSGEGRGAEKACGNTALAFASVVRKYFSHRACLSSSCIQRFGAPDTWSIPNPGNRKRQVSPDGPESLLISLPFGSKLPFSERSHHELNLCSVPVPVVWSDHSSSISPCAHPGPSGCTKIRISLLRFFRRVPSGCKTSKGLVGNELRLALSILGHYDSLSALVSICPGGFPFRGSRVPTTFEDPFR